MNKIDLNAIFLKHFVACDMELPQTFQCDNEHLELSCPSGTILNIKAADYGRKVIK